MGNKTIWITGGSSGIGEGLAYQYSKGNHIILSSRREDELNRVKTQCLALGAKSVSVYPMDLSIATEVKAVTEIILEKHPKIDFLFNNGGISQRSPVIETEMDVYERMMQINFLSYVQITKLILPKMIKNGGGHIIVTSSLMGKFATPFRSGYAASKHALHGFYEALRAEVYNKNIHITIVCPGYIKTNISLNALTGDGTPYQKMDDNQSGGIPVEKLTKIISNAVENQQPEVYIGGKEKLGIYFSKFFPNRFRVYSRKLNMPKSKG